MRRNPLAPAVSCGALLLMLAMVTGVPAAQSGRCMMEGFVVGESDYPGIAGATVELVGDQDAVRVSTTTDDKGRYSLEEIPHGEYTLRVTAPGYSTYEIPICMLSDTTTKLHVRLRKQG